MQNKIAEFFTAKIENNGVEKFISNYFNYNSCLSYQDINNLISKRTAFLTNCENEYFNSMGMDYEELLSFEGHFIESFIKPILAFQDWDNRYSNDKIDKDYAIETFETIDFIFCVQLFKYQEHKTSEKDILAKNFVQHCQGLLTEIDNYLLGNAFNFKTCPFYYSTLYWLGEISKITRSGKEPVSNKQIKTLFPITFQTLFDYPDTYQYQLKKWQEDNLLEKKEDGSWKLEFGKKKFSNEIKKLFHDGVMRRDIKITIKELLVLIKKEFGFEIGIESYNHSHS